MDPRQPFIRLVLLGSHGRGLSNTDDLHVALDTNHSSLVYTFFDGLPKGKVSPETLRDAVLLRIKRDGLPPDWDWKATPAMDSLVTWPAKYPLTYLCRRLRKVGWVVKKPAQDAATVVFGADDYAPAESQLPTLLFDLHWTLSQMLLDRGPKILGMAQVVGHSALWLATASMDTGSRPITDDFPDMLVQDVHDCEKWMLEFYDDLVVLRGRVLEAQAMPVDTSLVHFVQDYPNSIPRAGDFPIDHKERWDSASSVQRFFGIHKWHEKWPNWNAGERSYDYCWTLWRVEEAAYLLQVLDDERFQAIIDMWSQIYPSFQDIISTRADIRETQDDGDGPGKAEYIDDMIQSIRESGKTISELVTNNFHELLAICGPPGASPPPMMRNTAPGAVPYNWIDFYYNLPAPIPALQDLSPLAPALRKALEGGPGVTVIG